MADDIEKLIASLESEVKQSKDEEYKESALLRLQKIAETYQGDDRMVSSLELWEQIKNQPEEVKMMTGMESLDSILGGFRPKQLIVLSGITKHGKTTFAIDMTVNLQKENPAWLPFEEPAEDLILKFKERNEEPPLFFTPMQMKDRTVTWVEKKIIEGKAKFNTKIVFIDHLHYLLEVNGGETKEQAVSRVMYDLKTLCKKWDVIIVLLAHLRKVELNKHPNLEDLKDSSAIGQVADTVMFLWRVTRKKRGSKEVEISNCAHLSIQANRRTGRTGNIKLVFHDGRYHEENWDEDLIFGSTSKKKENDW